MIAANRIPGFYAYADAVASGEQVACQQVKFTVARYFKDREREGDSDFPYYFDEDGAERAIEFFPTKLRHTIGRYAHLRFQLELWQQFGIGNIYGWRRVDDGTRRFRHVLWMMARKNGKSALAAGMAHYGAGFDVNPETQKVEAVAEVILAATKREQADRVVFAEVKRMAQASGEILTKTQWKYNQLNYLENDGCIVTVGSNRPYDGLNPSQIMLDELHEWRELHRPFYDTMLTGSGSRSQPLIVRTTTAGDDKSHIFLNEYNYGCGVAAGTIDDDRWFPFIFEIDADDDPLDESVWIKANPNLGVSVKLDYLRDAAKVAENSAIDLNRFIRYHGNRIVSSTERAFDLGLWDQCHGELSNWDDADAIGAGIDLGGRDDLAAWAMVARFSTGETKDGQPVWRYEAKVFAYIAEDTNRDLNRAPFAQWIHEDRLHCCKYPISEMEAAIGESCRRHIVEDIAYDPYNGQQISENLSRAGMTIASMAQNTSHFHEPITDLMQAMRDGRFRHNGCPMLRWCAGNAVIVRDRNDRWMYDKRDSTDKIDPVVAMTMAYRRAMVAPQRASGSMFVY